MFELKERDGLARICILETPHGRVETPALLPVINPHSQIIPAGEMFSKFRVQAVMTNAYILWQGPLRERARSEGVHKILGFEGSIMTDSGAFQSHIYGEVSVSNREIVEFQRAIGSDIGTILDVVSSPDCTASEAARDVEETLRRAKEAEALKGDMMLAGAVQGALHMDLREKSARGLSEINGEVSAVGGVVPLMESYRFHELTEVVVASKRGLRPDRPVHLFGAGHPMIFALASLLGCDLFDSSSYAKYARDGRAMFIDGTRKVADLRSLPCECPVCSSCSVEEFSSNERGIAEHNLHVSLGEIRRVKQAIREGDLWELVERRCRNHPNLLDALRSIRNHNDFLEKYEPVSRKSAFYFTGPESQHRPLLYRLRRRLSERYEPPERRRLVVLLEGSRPFARHYAKIVERVTRRGPTHFVVASAIGPVPLELDEFYPISQSFVPARLDAESSEAAEVFLQNFIREKGYEFGLKWRGDETLEELPESQPYIFDIDLWRIRATIDMQFGRRASEALLRGQVKLVKSRKTGRIRNVLVNGAHVLSLRAHDGLFTLKVEGARRLHAAFPPPALRIMVQTDTAQFNQEGKNVFCKFVKDCDDAIRPGDEVLVVTEADELVAVAQAAMNRDEMLSFRRGVAAYVREGLPLSSREKLLGD